MWVCLEHKYQELVVHGTFCCNDHAIRYAEQNNIKDASFHKIDQTGCCIFRIEKMCHA